MRRWWLSLVLVLAPLAAQADPVLPEGFAGKLPAIMNLLYPKWEPSTQLTGNIVNGALERARLRDAKVWESDGHRGLAVIVQTWTGDACQAATCPPMPADVAVVELAGGKPTLLVSARGALKLTEATRASLDTTGPRVDTRSLLLGVREESEKDERAQTMLRLFRVEGAALRSVFERKVRDARASQKASDAGCSASLSTDDLEAAPYPIKVTERCQETKRSATEFWRWAGTEYKLHGPASNAADERTSDDENEK